MKDVWYIRGFCAESWEPAEIDAAYRVRFNWGEGRRLPDESKAVHLVCERALRQTGIENPRNLGAGIGIVLTSGFGGLASYEKFRDGLGTAMDLQPLAFSFSLPGIPASVLSLYYGITGPVTSLASPTNRCGADAINVAIGLLRSGLCEMVIAGSWYYPSVTARQCGGASQASAAIAVIAPNSGISDKLVLRVDTHDIENGHDMPEQVRGDPWYDCLASPPRPDAPRRIHFGRTVLVISALEGF
uniref:Beta-ketoacyl synthase, N-terminal domain n=1 Tax=Candidatus Kentrum sp. FM TaxID=2126340 RepID=A0A450VRZ4_9GAMM|nr:MAG: Beta-ketoacyl synthase, N-terminal domain [Candidatus Kentron sp. FM]VFJ47320.1 MAG: Beta-ketoacyl synthase, N-terminal domain [Candidatus Kentron sp. FM]VFK07550.1 MAG: Beta-ketoacyl synthase, N-terminal domain [Candidatus Kentron sp. FM]